MEENKSNIMKLVIKYLKQTYLFLKSIFLQFLLTIVAFNCWEEALRLGNEETSRFGVYTKEVKMDSYPYRSHEEDFGTDVALSTGYDGGAVAMGMICSVCIIMIVWLEINKKRNHTN